jgi:AcrR family transcriptional regulator
MRRLSQKDMGRPKQAAKSEQAAKSAGETRWRRRKDARPQEILDAALQVFAARGFTAARLEEIASRAGVAKGTIYLYFDSKESVFRALVQERLVSRLSGFAGVAGEQRGPAAPLLAELLRTMGTFLRTSDDVVLPKIVIAEAGNFPELARMYREEVIARGLGLLGGIISGGIARGEFKPIPVEHAVRLALAPLLLIAIWRTTFAPFDETPYDYEGLVEAHIATLLQGLGTGSAV